MYGGLTMQNAKKRGRYWIPMTVFAVGIAFVVLGIYRDEVSIVLAKAVAICQECIGIG